MKHYERSSGYDALSSAPTPPSFSLWSFSGKNRETSEERYLLLYCLRISTLTGTVKAFTLTLLCISEFPTGRSGVLVFFPSACLSLWCSCCFSFSFFCRAKTVSSWVTLACRLSLALISSFLQQTKTIMFVSMWYLLQTTFSCSQTFSLTWRQQPVPAFSCRYRSCPGAPPAAASFSPSPPGCAPVSAAALLSEPLSGGTAAPSARQGTSPPAACSLQSDVGQENNHYMRSMWKCVRREMALELSFAHLCVVKILHSDVRKRFDDADFGDDFKLPAELGMCLL